MREDTVIKAVDGNHYKIRFQSRGFIYPEDTGLWYADRVVWNWKVGYWMHQDDDVYILTDEGAVVAREIGWDLRREEICKQQIGERYGITKAQELWKTPQ